MITPCAKKRAIEIISRVRSSVKELGVEPEFSARSLFSEGSVCHAVVVQGLTSGLTPALALHRAQQLFILLYKSIVGGNGRLRGDQTLLSKC